MGAAGGDRVEAVVFDWDGTAVPDRRADAGALRARVDALSRAGVHLFVVSGTRVGNVDGQLAARPPGPGRLFLCLNRGSEVFDVGPAGPAKVWARAATPEEESALDRAADLTVERLRVRGLGAQVVSQRLNRRKIDLLDLPEWSDPPKALIASLLGAVTSRLRHVGIADLAEVVACAGAASREAGLSGARITTDVKHVEIGLTDKSDSARWAAAWLAQRGVTGSLVMVAGDEFGSLGGTPGSDSLMLVPELARAVAVSVGVEPGGAPPGVILTGGGPDRFLGLLDDQLALRAARRVPSIDEDPRWVVNLPSDHAGGRAVEALGVLSNGWAASRCPEEGPGPGSPPPLVVSGVYTADGAATRLLPGPCWTGLRVEPDTAARQLDLRTGVLVHRRSRGETFRALRFVSAADPHLLALRVEGTGLRSRVAEPLSPPDPATGFETRDAGDVHLGRTSDPGGGGIVVAARDRWAARGPDGGFERLAAWAAAARGKPAWEEALRRLVRPDQDGFDTALADHRRAWADRWADAEVTIDGSPDDELAARFAVFHLLSAGPDDGEAAVGARGLTGVAYGGHVFWDADVFVLPAVAALHPGIARAMLEYRLRRLAAARDAAVARGLRGARFPWESAADGSDVTPRSARGTGGELVAIRTGEHEEHIVADVAWAAFAYAAWTGDTAVLTGAALPLIVETARYWASRARFDGDGRAHLDGVMGPDEYHEVVNDNAFTNVMARWNLRAAARLAEDHAAAGVGAAETSAWRRLADALVDGYDAGRGVYEQFAGYWGLEPLLVAQVGTPPLAADILIGADRVSASQLIKQADVVMLHHLVPDEVVRGSLRANLAFYEPRTAHGSSLSPAVHASLLARDGQPDRALGLFRIAARLDLDDLTGTTGGGLHLATFGGLWQALAFGFLGLRPQPGFLEVDPCLPADWDALALRFRLHGHAIAVRADHETVRITCTSPLHVRLPDGSVRRCAPPGATFPLPRRSP